MPSGLRESLTDSEIDHLKVAMNWVIPPDGSPGAGTEEGLAGLFELVDSLGQPVVMLYRSNLKNLVEADLADPNHPFASAFVDHVRDWYYANPETGSWSDIGFVVTG